MLDELFAPTNDRTVYRGYVDDPIYIYLSFYLSIKLAI